MKKLSAFLTLLIVVVTLFAAASTVVAAPEWVFDSEEALGAWSFGNIKYEITDGVLKVVPTNWDPTITHTMKGDEIVDCKTYKYVAFNICAATPITKGGLFFGTSVNPGPKGPDYSEYDLINDGKWHDYIIDMTSYEHGLWEGNLNKLRLDPQNSGQFYDCELYVGRIGVFKTEEEAKAFLAKQVYPDADRTALPQWIFNGGSDDEIWQTNDAEKFDDFGITSYNATGEDTRLIVLLNSIYKTNKMIFNADEYKYFAVRYNATSGDERTDRGAVLFFSRDENRGFTDKNLKLFNVKTDSKYHNEVVDLSDVANWSGNITAVRLDMINLNITGDSYIISRMGFFKTEAEAQAFLEAASLEDDSADFDKLLEYRTDDVKLIFPAYTLDFGYKMSEYLLSSTEIGTSGDNAVVAYTDNAGNESVVSLSDVNVAGYARYVAAKPGTYTLKYSSKNFDDIGGHWGEEYIKYLSAREIFGGTSPTEFSPEMPLTRGMFITALGRMHGVDTDNYSNDTGYADVNADEYYAPYITWSKENGILPSVGETAFAPEESLSRADMALAINNYIKVCGFNIKPFGFGSEFIDIASCTDAQRAAILNIQDKGIINGVGDGKFEPDGMLTRAEAATVLTRLIKGIVGANYGNRFDRSKFLIGAFGYNDNLINSDSMAEFVGMDLDYLLSYKAENKLLRLLEEYNMAFIASNRIGNNWWGGDGDNAGTYAESHSPSSVKALVENAPKSESIVGDYMVDEPSAKDFAAINDFYQEYVKYTDGKLMPLVNLYPNYGSTQPENNPNAVSQLGTTTYAEHIKQYVENMDLDYISLDNYPMQSTGCFAKYLQNLDEVGAACRDNDLDMWIIIQTGANSTAEQLTPQQLEWQMYACMAYGANGIIHACYAANWFNHDTNCVDDSGNITETYVMAKAANEEIHRVGEVFMDYDYKGTYATGYKLATDNSIAGQLSSQNARAIKRDGKIAEFDGIAVDSNGGCLIGTYESFGNASNKALMLVNCRNPYSAGKKEQEAVAVTLTLTAGKTVTAYENGYPTTYTADNSGNIVISIPAGEGVFVTVDNI